MTTGNRPASGRGAAKEVRFPCFRPDGDGVCAFLSAVFRIDSIDLESLREDTQWKAGASIC